MPRRVYARAGGPVLEPATGHEFRGSLPFATVERNDLKIDVYRSRDERNGASDWAVRVTHLPSGIMVTRVGEGSDASDREAAAESAIEDIKGQLARERP